MHTARPSASLVALALVTMVVAASPAAAGPLSIKSVGEIFVDAQGLAQGQNLAGRVSSTQDVVGKFQATGLGTTVFDSVRIDGFSASRPVEGIGTPTLTMTGPNAKVLLHDNLHSILEIEATQPASVTFALAPGVTATQEGARGGIVRLTQGGATLGHLVAVGAEGARTRGEAIVVRATEVGARLQSGSELLFVAKARGIADAGYQDALVSALADGALASHYITEFEGSAVKTSQLVTGEAGSARTSVDGAIATALSARPKGPVLLVYELAYETLPAQRADDVAVYLDGELAQRVDAPGDVLAEAKAGAPVYYAASEGGRTHVLAASPEGGEHRVVVTVGAQAATEPQGRAESDADDDARVYGGFEHHANGKLTGEFLSGVLPDDRATLLGLTALATRTEVFRNVSVDGGASATFHAVGDDEMRIATAKADLALVDDAHATMVLSARAPSDARYELASGVTARALQPGLLALTGPHGSAGALVLLGHGSLEIDGASVAVHLERGDALLYRAAPDEHASEDAVLRAIADGRVGAQLLAGVHEGALVAKATSWRDDARATIAPADGALDVTFLADAATSYVLDVRGGALAAQDAADLRVLADGVALPLVASAEDALAEGGEARYHAAASAEGALRLIVHATGRVLVESAVDESARERADADAFGAFRLYADGSAVGDFVSLKADRSAGAITGLATNARASPLLASMAAGRSPYVRVAGEGSAVLTLQNDEARIEVSDSTNAFTKIVALVPTDAAFRLADGLHAEARGQGVVDLVSSDGEHVASIVAAKAAMLAVRADGDVRASLAEGGEIVLRTHDGIESELSAAQRAMLNEAIAAGRVAGQVTVQAGAVASATYGGIILTTEATRQRVDLTIDSATEAGRTLLVSLDPTTIAGMARGKATIRFDGELARQAASYADVLDASDDEGAAEYFVLAGDAGTQVLVSIPHFSVHVVTLEQDDGEPANTILFAATVLLGLVVVVQSIFLARRKRAQNAVELERRP